MSHYAFYISDGTAITAETIGHATLSQFELEFEHITLPFVENEDIAKANAIISVPVNPDFASLKLGQCVLLTAYEWMRQANVAPEVVADPGKSDWATGKDVEALVDHYQDRLDEAGFFFPPDKAPSMKVVFRNMFSRMPLTRADVQMLHGVMRQMVRWKEKDSGTL